MSKKLYYDCASTTKPFDFSSSNWFNSSALYKEGLKCNKTLQNCIDFLKDTFFVEESGKVIFTSGATEANNLLIYNISNMDYPTVITSPIEHPSILEPLKHYQEIGKIDVVYADVDHEGHIIPESIIKFFNDTKKSYLCTIQAVNNETGAIQPLKEIGAICEEYCKEYNVLFHSDFTQGCGKIDLNMKECNLDYISFSGHKFNGIKGCGALICVNEYATKYIQPMIFGGHQQDNIRSGTISTDLINHMCCALKTHIKKGINRTQKKNRRINEMLEYLFGMFFYEDQYRINSVDYNIPIFSISFKGCSSGYIMQELDKKGIMVSTGSACHTGDLSPSYVLTAMKCPDEYINNTIRISFDPLDESTELPNLTELVTTIASIIKE